MALSLCLMSFFSFFFFFFQKTRGWLKELHRNYVEMKRLILLSNNFANRIKVTQHCKCLSALGTSTHTIISVC